MSPARRLLLTAVVLVVAILGGTAVVARLLGSSDPPFAAVPQEAPGPVLLVPGYGGATGSLQVLAASLRAAGRSATIVALPGDGTGDLRGSVTAVEAAANATGAPSVDVIGYSAGGVVARLWAVDNLDRVRRIVTLGSPHHGTKVAGVATALVPGACPLGCQQLAPGSDLLDDLNDDETPDGPQWLAIWTEQDETVTPPDSARLDGAVNVAVQDVCPGLAATHGQLPTLPLVRGLVLQALSAQDIEEPSAADCAALSARVSS